MNFYLLIVFFVYNLNFFYSPPRVLGQQLAADNFSNSEHDDDTDIVVTSVPPVSREITTFGHRQKGDNLIYRYMYASTQEAGTNGTVQRDLPYPPINKNVSDFDITCIQTIDIRTKYGGGIASIVTGGIGHRHVIVRLTSFKDKGFYFIVNIYGKEPDSELQQPALIDSSVVVQQQTKNDVQGNSENYGDNHDSFSSTSNPNVPINYVDGTESFNPLLLDNATTTVSRDDSGSVLYSNFTSSSNLTGDRFNTTNDERTNTVDIGTQTSADLQTETFIKTNRSFLQTETFIKTNRSFSNRIVTKPQTEFDNVRERPMTFLNITRPMTTMTGQSKSVWYKV